MKSSTERAHAWLLVTRSSSRASISSPSRCQRFITSTIESTDPTASVPTCCENVRTLSAVTVASSPVRPSLVFSSATTPATSFRSASAFFMLPKLSIAASCRSSRASPVAPVPSTMTAVASSNVEAISTAASPISAIAAATPAFASASAIASTELAVSVPACSIDLSKSSAEARASASCCLLSASSPESVVISPARRCASSEFSPYVSAALTYSSLRVFSSSSCASMVLVS